MMTIAEEIRAVARRARQLEAVPLSLRGAEYEVKRRNLLRRKAQLQKRIERESTLAEFDANRAVTT